MSLNLSLESCIKANKVEIKNQEEKVKEILKHMPISQIYLEAGSEIEDIVLSAECPQTNSKYKCLDITSNKKLNGVYYGQFIPFDRLKIKKYSRSRIKKYSFNIIGWRSSFEGDYVEFERIPRRSKIKYSLRIYLNKEKIKP